MALTHDKCTNCHGLFGRKKTLFHHKYYGLIKGSCAKKCKTKKREVTVDMGVMLLHKTQELTVARCPVCGRKEESAWYDKTLEEEWKDDSCE